MWRNEDTMTPRLLSVVLSCFFLTSSSQTGDRQTALETHISRMVKDWKGGCNGSISSWDIVSEPKLVTDLNCQMRSSKLTRCSWKILPGHPPDLSFLYQLVDDSGAEGYCGSMQRCTQYPESSAVRGGCDLQVKFFDTIYILFNGTLNNNETVFNTIRISPKRNVTQPPLNWTVTKTADNFVLRWTPPDLGGQSHWTYHISSNVCGETRPEETTGKMTHMLRRMPKCQTCISIRGELTESGSGWTDQTDQQCFDPELNMLEYAAIIIPLLFACLAVMIIVCCRKNKDIIFPKIPEPRDFLSEISDNNNKDTVHNHYVPAEEEDCKISLVMDPPTTNCSPDTSRIHTP